MTRSPMAGSDSTGRGLRAVLLSTAVAGVLGYAIQLLAPALLTDNSAYVAFSIFWSTLYLGVSAMSGVQQEVARAAHPRTGKPGAPTLRTFALWASAVVVLLALGFAALFGGSIFPASVPTFAAALVIGLLGYLAAAVLSGVLYGLRMWAGVAFAAIADAVIRALFVIVGLFLQLPVAILAALVAVPFGLAFALTWAVFRRRVVGAFTLDVGLRRLAAHSSSTVVAASATGVMISGLPMLIGITSASVPVATTGALLLTITVTRAPIVIPVIALQSFLISAVFRGQTAIRPGRLMRVLGAVLCGGVASVLVGWFVGPPIIGLISGGRFEIDGLTAAVIIFSAFLVAAMCVSGPALVATRRHSANVVGWVVAAASTAIVLVLPFGEVRVLAALAVPPAIGLAVHVIALLQTPPGSTTSAHADDGRQSSP